MFSDFYFDSALVDLLVRLEQLAFSSWFQFEVCDSVLDCTIMINISMIGVTSTFSTSDTF